MAQVELSMLVDIGLKYHDPPVNVFGHRFNRFNGKAQGRRATLSCDSSYLFVFFFVFFFKSVV